MIRKLAAGVAVLAIMAMVSAVHASDLNDLQEGVAKLELEQVNEKGYGYANGMYVDTHDGRFSLKANIQLQLHYEYDSLNKGRRDTNTFTIRRARIPLSGNAITKKFTYMFKPAFDNNGNASLLDVYLNYGFLEEIQIRGGQFKVPFSREYLCSAFKLSFADWTGVVTDFGVGRDIGVDLHGALFDKVFEYDVYVFNGNGRAVSNSNKAMIAGARLNFNIIGTPGYRLYDYDYTEAPQWGAGFAFIYDFGSDNAAVGGDKLVRLTGDTVLLYRGFGLEIEGDYVRNSKTSAYNYGLGGQASYFIVPRKLEIAAHGNGTIRRRGGALAEGSVNDYQAGGALNYYFYEDRIKVVTDYTYIWNNGRVQGQNDQQVRVQAQMNF